MADSRPVAAAEKRKLYQKEVAYREMIDSTFFSPLMGDKAAGGNFGDTGGGAFVNMMTDLEKERGENVTFYMGWALEGDGVEDDELLEDNEEVMNTSYDSLSLHLWRNAIVTFNDLDRKKTSYDIEKEKNLRLKDWGAQKIDQECFDALGTDISTSCYTTASGFQASDTGSTSMATAKTALVQTTSDLTVDSITQIRAYAENGGHGDRSIIPPVSIDGHNSYAILVHPFSLAGLKMTDDYKDGAKYCRERAKSNPFFTGAVTMIDNVVIYAHKKVTAFTDGGSGSDVVGCEAKLLGRGSLNFGFGKRPYTSEMTKDYGQRKGKAWNVIAGVQKPQFTKYEDDNFARDYSVLGFALSMPNIGGAIS